MLIIAFYNINRKRFDKKFYKKTKKCPLIFVKGHFKDLQAETGV